MADPDKDRTKADQAPESTWGATPEVKAAWDKRYGKTARREAERGNGGNGGNGEEK